jgi:hypothetical protein
MSRWSRLASLSSAERRALVEAAWCLIFASARLRFLPFARLAPTLGRHMAESPDTDTPGALAAAQQVRWAVGAASRVMPRKPNCFPRAVAAISMLRRREVASTLYLGVDPARSLEAHAWVRAGSILVTGGPDPGRFTVVSMFS